MYLARKTAAAEDAGFGSHGQQGTQSMQVQLLQHCSFVAVSNQTEFKLYYFLKFLVKFYMISFYFKYHIILIHITK